MSSNVKIVRIPPYIGEEPLVGRYYMAECERCGWLGSSSELTDDCQCTREEDGGMCLGHTLEVEPEQLFAVIQAMGKAHSGLVSLHGGGLGLPKEGWPAYHKQKMETLRDLTAGHYERKLAGRSALLREARFCVVECADPEAGGPTQREAQAILGKIDAALSAKAKPSAPVERDERAEYEEACHRRAKSKGRTHEPHYFKRRGADGTYLNTNAQLGWEIWQMRADLEVKS